MIALTPSALLDVLLKVGLGLWVVSAVSFVWLRRLVRTRHPDAWQRHGTPLLAPILDRRRWSRESSRFWWSGYRDLGDAGVNRAMTLCRVGFMGVVLAAIAIFGLQIAY